MAARNSAYPIPESLATTADRPHRVPPHGRLLKNPLILSPKATRLGEGLSKESAVVPFGFAQGKLSAHHERPKTLLPHTASLTALASQIMLDYCS